MEKLLPILKAHRFLNFQKMEAYTSIGRWKKLRKKQLNQKRFEIYQTISFVLGTLANSNDVTKLASKLVKITSFIEKIIENTFVP